MTNNINITVRGADVFCTHMADVTICAADVFCTRMVDNNSSGVLGGHDVDMSGTALARVGWGGGVGLLLVEVDGGERGRLEGAKVIAQLPEVEHGGLVPAVQAAAGHGEQPHLLEAAVVEDAAHGHVVGERVPVHGHVAHTLGQLQRHAQAPLADT
jgi:hypothetical protein